MIQLKSFVETVSSALQGTKVTDRAGHDIEIELGLGRWCDIARQVKQMGANMFFVGNGASAMMASHMAADATKNGGFRCTAFNDVALMTAISNDIDYESCFAEPLKYFSHQGDVLVAISSSGNSPNILRSIATARDIGLKIITISGMKPDNKCRQMGDLNFYIPASSYGVVEGSHLLLLHCWLDKFVDETL